MGGTKGEASQGGERVRELGGGGKGGEGGGEGGRGGGGREATDASVICRAMSAL